MCSWYWQDKAGAKGTGLRVLGLIVAMSAAIASADLIANDARNAWFIFLAGVLSVAYTALSNLGTFHHARSLCGQWKSLHAKWEALADEIEEPRPNLERLTWKVQSLRDTRAALETEESNYRISDKDRERYYEKTLVALGLKSEAEAEAEAQP